MAISHTEGMETVHAPVKVSAVELAGVHSEEETEREEEGNKNREGGAVVEHPLDKPHPECVASLADEGAKTTGPLLDGVEDGEDEWEDVDEDDDKEEDGEREDVDKDDDKEEDDGERDDLSLYKELMDGINDEGELGQVPDALSAEESAMLRKELRLIGEDRFLLEMVLNGKYTAKRLLTAFGVRPPFFLEGAPDEAYYILLGACITRELQKRVKLPQWNTVEDAVQLLKGAKNIVVLTGAGISTSLGIPDFRSKDTGLYARLEHLGLSDPQEVFDIHLFHQDPSIFYSVAKDILPSSQRFTPTHAFIRLLQDKGKLLTNFTQNIDNLEEFAGIEKDRLVQCHGSFATATCTKCRHQVECKAIYEDLKAGKVAQCENCLKNIQSAQPGLKRKRSSDGSDLKSKKQKKKKKKKNKQSYEDSSDDHDEANDDNIAVAGVMKPDITFFGEGLPARFHDRLLNHDRDLVDLVVVIGTSLKVAPVSEVVGIVPPNVPQIYISREACNHVEFDVDLLGDCDTVVTELCRRAGWDLRHEMVSDQPADVQLQEGYQSRFSVTSASV